MEEKFYSVKAYTWQHHILYWVANVTIYILFALLTWGDFKEPLINKLCYLPSQLIITYAIFYIIFPLLDRSRYLQSLASLFFITYIATTIARILKIYVYETALGHDAEKETLTEILTQQGPLLAQYMLWCFLTPIITTMIVLLINHYRREERLELLKKEKSISELNFLKSQVHPHFLFNTLNNLYSLAITSSPHTAIIAGKLHDILEYMFYKCNQKEVNIGDEVSLIQNYIDLEKIRYDEKLQVKFSTKIDNRETKIAPLILITLVENAFKHGVSGTKRNSFVDIELHVENEKLLFEVSNSKNPLKKDAKSGYREGIGLENMKKQVNLIYKERKHFEIHDRKGTFHVYLKIDLGNGK